MDEAEFGNSASFEDLRAKLFALAYRMLGSRAEAEDIVQDAWLKWHAADAQDLRSPAAWLTTITTHLAIDRLRHLQIERASQSVAWLPEPWLDRLAPSAEELALRAAQMSYGVMLLLERLKPEERAAFVLHEAFDCDYREIAKILAKSPANCRQIVHRAKTRLQRAGAPSKLADPAAHARVVERLRAAMDAQDTAGLMRLFCDMPEVVGEALDSTGEPATADAIATRLVARARSAQQTAAVRIEGMQGVALLRDGEIDALFDMSIDDGKIVALRVVQGAALLQHANDSFGRAAIRDLLQRIRGRGQTSVAVRRHFPVATAREWDDIFYPA
jgi:RNA polymerase sigma factor (sigma-70 family)